MNGLGFGGFKLGAMAGGVVGAVGGLFAVGVARALYEHNPRLLLETPTLSFVCWVVGGLTGWLMGGQLGRRLGMVFRSERAEIVGGVVGGLIPVALMAYWGWYLASH